MTSIFLRNTETVTARASGGRGWPVIITATDEDGQSLELTLSMNDRSVAERLAASINEAMACEAA